MIELDDLDKKLLKRLIEDARIPFRELARELNVDVHTISKRYKFLIKSGVIKSSSVIVDFGRIGYKATIDCDATVEKGKEDECISQLIKAHNVMVVGKTVGDHDVYFEFACRDLEDLRSLSKSLSEMEIKKITWTLCFESHFLFPYSFKPFLKKYFEEQVR